MFAEATARLHRAGMGHGCGDGTGAARGSGPLLHPWGRYLSPCTAPSRCAPELIWAIPPRCVSPHLLRWPRPVGGAGEAQGAQRSAATPGCCIAPWPWGEQPGAVSLLPPATSAVPSLSEPEDPSGAGRAVLGPPECPPGTSGGGCGPAPPSPSDTTALLAVAAAVCRIRPVSAAFSAPHVLGSLCQRGVQVCSPSPCPHCPGRSHGAAGIEPPESLLRAVLLRFGAGDGNLILVLIISSAGLA